jgi:hypothetical protein
MKNLIDDDIASGVDIVPVGTRYSCRKCTHRQRTQKGGGAKKSSRLKKKLLKNFGISVVDP